MTTDTLRMTLPTSPHRLRRHPLRTRCCPHRRAPPPQSWYLRRGSAHVVCSTYRRQVSTTRHVPVRRSAELGTVQGVLVHPPASSEISVSTTFEAWFRPDDVSKAFPRTHRVVLTACRRDRCEQGVRPPPRPQPTTQPLPWH